MDFDRMRGDWAAIRLMVRQQWNRLTDEDLEAIDGDREALLNVLEQRYDSPRERLEQQVSDFEGRIGGADDEDEDSAGRLAGAGRGAERTGSTQVTGPQQGSQGRQLYEEDSMPRNPQQNDKQSQGRGANAPTPGEKRWAEQDAGAGSMGNKRGAEQESGAGSMGNKRSAEQDAGSRQGGGNKQAAGNQGAQPSPTDKQRSPQNPGGASQGQQTVGGQTGRTDRQNKGAGFEDEDSELKSAGHEASAGQKKPQESPGGSRSTEQTSEQADGSSGTDKRSADQSDGVAKTDRQQQGGQKGKQPSIPSWQRQAERRPEQPRR